MKNLYEVQVQKDINESCYCESENWMTTEYDEIVLDYSKLPKEKYIVKLKKDEGLDHVCDIKNALPAHLGDFILSSSKIIMNNFIGETNSFYKKSKNCGNTDSFYTEKKYWDVLDENKLVGEELCPGQNDYNRGGVFYSLFLALKIKHCLTTDKFGILHEHKLFTVFNDSKRLLGRSQFFKMIASKKEYLRCCLTAGKNHFILE